MMHIYQFQRLNYFKLKNTEEELVEGMSRWAEYYLLKNSETPEYVEEAESIHNNSIEDTSEYGVGYRYVSDKYGDNLIIKVNKKYGI